LAIDRNSYSRSYLYKNCIDHTADQRLRLVATTIRSLSFCMMIYGTQLVGIQSVIAGQGMYRRTLNLTGRSQRVRRTPEPRHPQAPVLDGRSQRVRRTPEPRHPQAPVLDGRSQRVRRTPEPRHPQAPVLDESDRREDEFRTAAPRTSESASRLGVLLTY